MEPVAYVVQQYQKSNEKKISLALAAAAEVEMAQSHLSETFFAVVSLLHIADRVNIASARLALVRAAPFVLSSSSPNQQASRPNPQTSSSSSSVGSAGSLLRQLHAMLTALAAFDTAKAWEISSGIRFLDDHAAAAAQGSSSLNDILRDAQKAILLQHWSAADVLNGRGREAQVLFGTAAAAAAAADDSGDSVGKRAVKSLQPTVPEDMMEELLRMREAKQRGDGGGWSTAEKMARLSSVASIMSAAATQSETQRKPTSAGRPSSLGFY